MGNPTKSVRSYTHYSPTEVTNLKTIMSLTKKQDKEDAIANFCKSTGRKRAVVLMKLWSLDKKSGAYTPKRSRKGKNSMVNAMTMPSLQGNTLSFPIKAVKVSNGKVEITF